MRSYTLLLSAFLINNLFVSTSLADYTLGAGFSSQTLTIESTANIPPMNLAAGNNEETSTALNLFVDIYRSNFRFNGTMNISTYDDFALAILTGSIDYLILVGDSFNLFAGATFGSSAQAYSTTYTTQSNVASSPVIGYQLGGIINLNQSLTFEMGYAIRHVSLKTEFINFPVDDTVEITEISHAYINIGILF